MNECCQSGHGILFLDYKIVCLRRISRYFYHNSYSLRLLLDRMMSSNIYGTFDLAIFFKETQTARSIVVML